MKTHKIIKKLNKLIFTSTIIIQKENKILVDVLGSSLNDGELERILEVFPRKKYNTTVRLAEGKIVLEITKVHDFPHFMDFAFNPSARRSHSIFSFHERPRRH